MNKFKPVKSIFDKVNQYMISVYVLELILVFLIIKEYINIALCVLSAMFILQNAYFIELWQELRNERNKGE